MGDWILAAGNPFGVGSSVSAGIVSARGRDIGAGPFDDFLQIDAPINPGNSGGPTFNLDGQVIAVNTAIVSPTGGSVGIGFAVPSEIAQPIVAELLEQGADRPRLAGGGGAGRAQAAAGTRARAQASRSPASTGRGRRRRPGLRAGDVVTAVNDTAVDSRTGLIKAVSRRPPGTAVKLTVRRNGQTVDGARHGRPPPEREQRLMRILVVEDDKDVAGFVLKGLREAGHLAEHADNGRDGLFMAASEAFDAIILDRMLPGGIDGLRLLETLRAQDNKTPVMFLSALARWTSGCAG